MAHIRYDAIFADVTRKERRCTRRDKKLHYLQRKIKYFKIILEKEFAEPCDSHLYYFFHKVVEDIRRFRRLFALGSSLVSILVCSASSHAAEIVDGWNLIAKNLVCFREKLRKMLPSGRRRLVRSWGKKITELQMDRKVNYLST